MERKKPKTLRKNKLKYVKRDEALCNPAVLHITNRNGCVSGDYQDQPKGHEMNMKIETHSIQYVL